jgi:hypothetical protein
MGRRLMTGRTNAPASPSVDADAFRVRVRAFLRDNLPDGFVGLGGLEGDDGWAFVASWRRTLFEHGYLGLTWPKEYGGSALSQREAVVVAEEFARAGVPTGDRNDGFGIRLLGNTLLRWGTGAQKAHYLPRILSGEDIWCQGYSEPNAGSDLGNVGTRAVLDGDEWVVNGQKIWTSAGHLADHIFVLCRTDPHAKKHKGISFLLMDMRQPGIEVRPIKQITGDSHFNEVFFTDARAPKENIVGEVHNGWAVAMTMLGYERGEAAATEPILFRAEFERLVELAKQYGKGSDPVIRQRLAWCYSAVRIMELSGQRVVAQFLAGRPPGPDASIGKLHWSEYHKESTELAMAIMGPDGLAPTGRVPMVVFGPDDAGAPNSTNSWAMTFLNARAGTIYAGTSEVQRNIIGEQILGLPREPRADDGPWNSSNR